MSEDAVAATPDKPVAPEKKSGLGSVKVFGILTLIAGIIMVVAGGVTWFTVQSQLKAESITVAKDASSFAGKPVAGPFTAYAEATIINEHALKATGGKTYAEIPQSDDPAAQKMRTTAMNASFLRASLFTSVVAFGVAAMAAGIGVVFILVGLALMKVAKSRS